MLRILSRIPALRAGSTAGGADHLRTEVGELEELRVGDLAHRGGFGHGLGIRGENPVHVRPDLDLRRAQHRAEKGGRVVGRAPAERGRLPVRSRGDEPGDDRDSCVSGKPRAHQLPRPLPVHPRPAEAGVGAEKLPRVHVDRGDPMGTQAGGDEHRGEQFPEGEHPVTRAEGAFAQKLGPVRQAPEVVHRRIEAEGEARRFVGRSEGVEKLPVHLRDLPRHRRVSGVPSPRKLGDLDQPVRRSVDRGDDHDRGGVGPGIGDEIDDAPDTRGAADRGPPELHHPNRIRVVRLDHGGNKPLPRDMVKPPASDRQGTARSGIGAQSPRERTDDRREVSPRGSGPGGRRRVRG